MIVSYGLDEGRSLSLQILSRTSFRADALSSALSNCPNLAVNFEYVDMKWQSMAVSGKASGEEIHSALSKAGIDLNEYVSGPKSFSGGLDGVLQASVLFFLNERLRAINKSD